jgi:hypothetical protein
MTQQNKPEQNRPGQQKQGNAQPKPGADHNEKNMKGQHDQAQAGGQKAQSGAQGGQAGKNPADKR